MGGLQDVSQEWNTPCVDWLHSCHMSKYSANITDWLEYWPYYVGTQRTLVPTLQTVNTVSTHPRSTHNVLYINCRMSVIYNEWMRCTCVKYICHNCKFTEYCQQLDVKLIYNMYISIVIWERVVWPVWTALPQCWYVMLCDAVCSVVLLLLKVEMCKLSFLLVEYSLCRVSYHYEK